MRSERTCNGLAFGLALFMVLTMVFPMSQYASFAQPQILLNGIPSQTVQNSLNYLNTATQSAVEKTDLAGPTGLQSSFKIDSQSVMPKLQNMKLGSAPISNFIIPLIKGNSLNQNLVDAAGAFNLASNFFRNGLTLIPNAYAANSYDLQINDGNGNCESIGGTFSGNTTCTLSSTFTMGSGDSLTVNSGVTLDITSSGNLNNFGSITNNGNISNSGHLDNSVAGVTFSNTGTITNNAGGFIQGYGTITTTSLFSITNNGATFDIPVTIPNTTISSPYSLNFPILITAGVTLTINSGNTLTVNTGGDIIAATSGIISNSGTISNSGFVNVNGTLNNNAGSQFNNNVGSSIINYGTITDNGGNLNNGGTISNLSGANFNSNAGIINTGSILNQGLITESSGSITNSGTITNNNIININGGSSLVNDPPGNIGNTGTLAVNSGAISNAGTIANGGTITVNTGSRIDNSFGGFHSGNINNSNTISISTGGIISNNIGATITNNSGGAIDNSGTITNFGTLNTQSSIVNQGAIDNNSGGSITYGSGSGATIDNHGSIINDGTIHGNGSFGNISNHSGGTLTNNSDGTITLDNNGQINNNGGTITNNGAIVINNSILNNSLGNTFNNGGTITINNSGTLLNFGSLANTGTITNNSGGTITNNSGGTIDISGGGTISNSGNISNNPGGTISNSNTTSQGITNSGSITNSGTISNSGFITNNSGGTILNSGAISNSGTIDNPGTINNLSSGTISATGGIFRSSLSSIINNGSITAPISIPNTTISSSYTLTFPIIVQPGITLTINSGTTLTINSGVTITISGNNSGNASIVNDGTIANDGIINTNNSDSTLTNSGTITINSGGINNGGTITNNSGGTMTVNSGGTINNNAGATISNSGTITNNSGGTIANNGLIKDYCVATFTNNGTYSGAAVLVACNTTTLTTSLNATSINLGSAVQDTATLSGGTISPPAGGSITFKVFGNNLCTSLVQQIGNVTISGNGAYQSSSFTPSSAGTYYFQANYTGDFENRPSVSTCGSEVLTVNPAISASVAFDKSSYIINIGSGTLTLTDNSLPSSTSIRTETAHIQAAPGISDTSGIDITLTETGVGTNIFVSNKIIFSQNNDDQTNGILHVEVGDTVTATFSGATSDTATILANNGGTLSVTSVQNGVSFPQIAYTPESSDALTVIDNTLSTSSSPRTVNAYITSTADPNASTTNPWKITLTETGVGTNKFVSSQMITFTNLGSNLANYKLEVPTVPPNSFNPVMVTYTGGDGTKYTFGVSIIASTIPQIINQVDTTYKAACSTDTDNDGICDSWEHPSNGVALKIPYADSSGDTVYYQLSCDENASYNPNLQTSDHTQPWYDPLGDQVCPSPNHKDVYVQVSWMTGQKPSDTALANVVKAFYNAPTDVNNPDGSGGINLHLIKDSTSIGFFEAQMPIDGSFYTPAQEGFRQIKQADFGIELQPSTSPTSFTGTQTQYVNDLLTAKRQVFHYVLFAHDLSEYPASSGWSEILGNDLIVSLGTFTGDVGSVDQQAGTLMHELGHNLNLNHGGVAPAAFNCKPNHLSVMNYLYQFPATSGGFLTHWNLDYAHSRTLYDETQLSESAGLPASTPTGLYAEIGGITSSGTQIQPQEVQTGTPASGSYVDFNHNGVLDSGTYSQDTHYFGIPDCTNTNIYSAIGGSDDWAGLNLNFRSSSNFADGIYPAPPSIFPNAHTDLTSDTVQKIFEVTGATPAPAAPETFDVGQITASANPVNSGIAFTTTASFDDPFGTEQHTATWNWGDGTTSSGTIISESSGNAPGSVTGSHSYSRAGIYTITLTMHDSTGTHTGTNTFQSETALDPTSTTLTSSANPSISGNSVTFKATVSDTANPTNTPNGSVTFSIDGAAQTPAVPISGGVATLATSSLALGQHTMMAVYSGDVSDAPDTSNQVSQTVIQGTSVILTSSNNPSLVGQSVTLQVTITPSSAGGTVTFSIDGAAQTPAVPISGGVATLATSSLAVGQHAISAEYSGDTNYPSNTSNMITQTVNMPSPQISSPPGSTTLITNISSSSVSITIQGSAYASSTVTISDGSTSLGSMVATSGSWSLPTILAAGTHSITATSTLNGVTSAPSNQVQVTVETSQQAAQQLTTLIGQMSLDKGMTSSLDSKLSAAMNSLNSGDVKTASNQLGAFINEVNAQSGKKLTPAQATDLSSEAQAIINAIK